MMINDDAPHDAPERRIVMVASGRHAGRMATLAILAAAFERLDETATRTVEAVADLAPAIEQASQALRAERGRGTPPPFANPAKLARGEHRRGKPPQWRNR
jgi:hypothetical protein